MAATNTEIGYEAVKEGLEKTSFLLIDVRPNQEYAKEYITGAKNIPASDLLDLVDMDKAEFQQKYGFPQPAPSDPIVTTCFIGKRCLAASEVLRDKGFSNVKYYGGSLKEWKQNKAPTRSDVSTDATN